MWLGVRYMNRIFFLPREVGILLRHEQIATSLSRRMATGHRRTAAQRADRGGQTAAILSSLTSTCRRHDIDPQRYLTQLLTNMPAAPISQLPCWLLDRWKQRHPAPS